MDKEHGFRNAGVFPLVRPDAGFQEVRILLQFTGVPHSQPVESLLSSREEISYVLPLISCVLPLISRPSLLLLQLLQVEFLLVISVTEMDGRSALCIAAFKTFIFHNADKMLQVSPHQGTVHFKT